MNLLSKFFGPRGNAPERPGVDEPVQAGPDLQVHDLVKFIGGKYNGFHGNIAKLGTTECSVFLEKDHKMFEVVESVKFLRRITKEEL